MKYYKMISLPTKIVFVLWTLDAFYMLFSGESGVNFFQWLIVWIFGCFIFCGITQLISSRKKKRIKLNKDKSISEQENVYLEYQEALNNMGMIFVDFFKEHYFVEAKLLKSEAIGENYRFIIEIKEENQLEYILSQRDIIYQHMHQTIQINHMHGKYIEILTGNDQVKEQELNDSSKNMFDYMDGHDFEYFCADILTKNGFSSVEVTQGSGDHGIDILAEKDGITYAIQCKCYSKDIGNAAVQQAHTGKSIYKKDIAVVLTNRFFTQQAQEEANALGVKLWDRDKLLNLIKASQTF